MNDKLQITLFRVLNWTSLGSWCVFLFLGMIGLFMCFVGMVMPSTPAKVDPMMMGGPQAFAAKSTIVYFVLLFSSFCLAFATGKIVDGVARVNYRQ